MGLGEGQRKIAKNRLKKKRERGKIGKRGKNREKRKNQKDNTISGRFFHFAPSDREGWLRHCVDPYMNFHMHSASLDTDTYLLKYVRHKRVHLAQIIPRRFLKPAVCKYPITVIKSEIYILFPKPYPLMWYLVHGNRVRNARNRSPQTRRMRSPKVALLKIVCTVRSTTRSTVESMMTRMMSTKFRCSRNRLSSRSPLCWFNEYVHVRVVVLQRRAYRIF